MNPTPKEKRESLRIGKMGDTLATLNCKGRKVRVAIENESAGGSCVVISNQDLEKLRMAVRASVKLVAADGTVRSMAVKWIETHEKDSEFAKVGLKLLDCEIVNRTNVGLIDSMQSAKQNIGSSFSGRIIVLFSLVWIAIAAGLVWVEVIPGKQEIMAWVDGLKG